MGKKTFNRANPSFKQIDIYDDFSGGLNTQLEQEAVRDNQFRVLVNFSNDAAGAISKRFGLYRIPYIQKNIQNYLETYYKIDIEDASIIDIKIFNDGSHWIFNYITRVGIIVLILDRGLTIPVTNNQQWDLTDYIKFYPISPDLISNPDIEGDNTTVGEIVKISSFKDSFIMITSTYNVQTTTPPTPPIKQIQLFSWNPIYQNIEGSGGEIEKVRPGWIEAAKTFDARQTNITFIDRKQSNAISNTLNFLDGGTLPNPTLVITPSHYIGDVVNDINITSFSIEYKVLNSFATIEFNWIKNNVSGTKVYTVLNPVSNAPLTDNIVFTIAPNTLWPFSKNSINLFINPIDDKPTNGIINIDYSNVASGGEPTQTYYKNSDKGNFNNSNSIPTTLTMFDNESDYNKYKNRWGDTTQSIAFNPPIYSAWTFSKYYEIPQGINRATKSFITDKGVLQEDTIDKTADGPGPIFSSFPFYSPYNSYFQFNTDKSVDPDQRLGVTGQYSHGANYKTKLTRYRFSATTDAITVVNAGTTIYKPEDIVNGNWLNLENLNGLPPEIPSPQNVAIFIGSSLAKWEINSIQDENNKNSPIQFTDFQYKESKLTSINNKLGVQVLHTPSSMPDLQVSTDWYEVQIKKQLVPESEGIKNIKYENNILGIGSGTYNVTIQNGQETSTQLVLTTATLNQNNFLFEKLTSTNINKYLTLAGEPIQGIVTVKTVSANTLFNESNIAKLKNLKTILDNNYLVSIEIPISYKNSQGQFIKVATADINRFNLEAFLYSISQENYDSLSFRFSLTKYNDNIPYVSIQWYNISDINNQVWQDFAYIDFSTIFDGDTVADNELILGRLNINVIYNYNEGAITERVLSYKQLSYIKPNLNDLSFLWYNLILFSKSAKSTSPDIYNSDFHPNISWDLVRYPNLNIQNQDIPDNPNAQKISLFGIRPVNDIILQPGTQKFQLFYKTFDDTKPETLDLIVALTAMSVQDYTSLINSPDYSTTGLNAASKITAGPVWQSWDSLFKSNDDNKTVDDNNVETPAPRLAVFEWSVPSSESPYLILIQVANRDVNLSTTTQLIPLVSTIVETRIEMQPGTSENIDINPLLLFDEFITTNKLDTYKSHLWAYGRSNKIFVSDVARGNFFPLKNIITLDTPEPVLNLQPFENRLVISTTNTRWYIDGSSFDTSSSDAFNINLVSSDTGVLAPNSEVSYGENLYFLDRDGFKQFKTRFATSNQYNYKRLDLLIENIVPKDIEAVGLINGNKYYVCFPNYQMMLVYNFQFDSWVQYKSKFFNFATMFVQDSIIYGVDRNNYAIFKFDENTFVDNWNEIEDGYIEMESNDCVQVLQPNGSYVKQCSIAMVQNGEPIVCELKTKQLTQSYYAHNKKYDYGYIHAEISATDKDDNEVPQITSYIYPKLFLDNDFNQINYNKNTIQFNEETNTYTLEPENTLTDSNNPLRLSSPTRLSNSLKLGTSLLGNEIGSRIQGNNFYYFPIKKQGSSLAIQLEFSSPTKLKIKSIGLRSSLRKLTKNRNNTS